MTGSAVSFDADDTLANALIYSPSGYNPMPIARASYMTRCGMVTVFVVESETPGQYNTMAAVTVMVDTFAPSPASAQFAAAGVAVYTAAPFSGGSDTQTLQLFSDSCAVLPVVTWEGLVYTAAQVPSGLTTVLVKSQMAQQVTPTSASNSSFIRGVEAGSGSTRALSLLVGGYLMFATSVTALDNMSVYVADAELINITPASSTLVPATYAGGAMMAWTSWFDVGSGDTTQPYYCLTWFRNDFANTVTIVVDPRAGPPFTFRLEIRATSFGSIPDPVLTPGCVTYVNDNVTLPDPGLTRSRIYVAVGYANSPRVDIYYYQSYSDTWTISAADIFSSLGAPPTANLANLMGDAYEPGTSSYVYAGFEDGTLCSVPFSIVV